MYKFLRNTNLYFSSIGWITSLQLLFFAFYHLVCSIPAVGLFINPSKYGDQFSDKFKNKFKGVGAVRLTSARSGIYAILNALGIGEGDEVLVTGYTCHAVPEPLLFLGITPIYVDIEPDNFGMDPVHARNLITPRTKAIIIQHTYGIPASIKELVGLANEYNLRIIEDCALALGSKKDDRFLGTFGDASVFSFELSKTLTIGWGGMALINKDKELAKKVNDLVMGAGKITTIEAFKRLLQAGLSGILYRHEFYRVSGYFVAFLFKIGFFQISTKKFKCQKVPQNYLSLPSELQWVALGKMFDQLSLINSGQREKTKFYNKILKDFDCGAVTNGEEGIALIRFPILVLDRKRFVRLLADNGIEVGQWFDQPISYGGVIQNDFGYMKGSCPNADFISNHIVNLPTHGRLSKKDIGVILRCLNDYLCDNEKEREFIKYSLSANANIKHLQQIVDLTMLK